jgi:tetratricopeptide (TPR) repeat protein
VRGSSDSRGGSHRREAGRPAPGHAGEPHARGRRAEGARADEPRATKATKAAAKRRAARKTAAKAPPTRPPSPEELLGRALEAKTPRARGLWARRGLATRAPLDTTTHAMLLRQLYLAHFEERRFAKAVAVAEQALALGVLSDVAHQDAARAHQALGDVDAAAAHLRIAARVSPPKRRAFHWWTLGSLFHLNGRYAEAMSALERAARWGTTDKPLYQGHLAVVQCASGQPVADLAHLMERLSEAPAGQGYGRFVLGHMAYYDRRFADARRYLEAFVRRSSSGRAVVAIALAAEIEAARRTLARMGDPA